MQHFIEWFAQVLTLLQPLWQIFTWFVCDCIPEIFAFITNNPLVVLIIIATSVGTYLTRH